MALKQVFGRLLLVLCSFIGGAMKLIDSVQSEKLLITSYSKFYSKSKEFGLSLPLAPVIVATYSKEIIILTGILLILGSFLVIVNSRLGVYLITLLYSVFCIVVHLPILHTNSQEWNQNFYNLLLNLTIIAGLWLTCDKDSSNSETSKSTSNQVKEGKLYRQRKKKE